MCSPAEALVTDVQRFSLHDGPGIRTTVFFKGCSLACRWCHNPEAIGFRNEPLHARDDCIACGDCVAACEPGALRLIGATLHIDASRCDRCMRCVEVCPSGAWRAAAQSYDVDALVALLLRDRAFYGAEGGVTLSGGEPLVHVSFLRELLPRLRGLNVTVQTAGHFVFDKVEPFVDQIQLFQFDLKLVDERDHLRLVGRGNQRILANLERLRAMDAPIELRMPVIPGHNDDEANLSRAARLLHRLSIETITLLAYHPLGDAKDDKLLAPDPQRLRDLGQADLDRVQAHFSAQGIAVRRHDEREPSLVA